MKASVTALPNFCWPIKATRIRQNSLEVVRRKLAMQPYDISYIIDPAIGSIGSACAPWG
jgi:hypothetical protein